MAAVAQPVAFMTHLPLGEAAQFPSENPILDLASGNDPVRYSAISLDVSRRSTGHGRSVVQFPIILDLGPQFPRIRELHLRYVAASVHPNPSPDKRVHLPRFAALESLSIAFSSNSLSSEVTVTNTLFRLFPHMPRLRSLEVRATSRTPYAEPDSELPYPEPPFSLERFVCTGALSIRACAHIVSCSRNTLDELRVNLAFDEEMLLIDAVELAAPRLRSLALSLGPRASHVAWRPIRLVVAALSRVERMHLDTPQTLDDALYLPSRLVSLRELSLACTLHLRDVTPPATAEGIIACMRRMQSLRTVALRGFDPDLGDAKRGALLEYCRARRIRCSITN